MNMQVNFCWLSSANTFEREFFFSLINWSQMCHWIPLLLETFGGKLQHISIAAATGYAPDGPAKIVRFLSTRTWMYPGAPLCGFATQCIVVFLDKKNDLPLLQGANTNCLILLTILSVLLLLLDKVCTNYLGFFSNQKSSTHRAFLTSS